MPRCRTRMQASKVLSLAGICVVATALLTGCKSLKEGAREDFSRTYSCPLDQVESRARSDLNESDLRDWPKPPADIKGDPARLATWEKNIQTQKDGINRQSSVYEVRGCGKHILTACNQRKGNAAMVSCRAGDFPPRTPW